MDHRLREFFIAKIRLGDIYIKSLDLTIKPAKLKDILLAYDVYNDSLEEAVLDGLMTVEENKNYMLNTGQWTNLDDDSLEEVNTLVENTKVSMYENYNEPKKLKTLRKSLVRRQNAYKSLLFKQNANYANTAEAFAETARLLFLVEKCSDSKDIDLEDNINTIVSAYNQSLLEDPVIRELCRNEPWRSFWSIRDEVDKLFFNEEPTINQRNLLLWSKSYDSIYESVESPPQQVIDDDDCLDGWFIVQNRKRKAEANKKQAEDSIKNEKVKNSDNVFLISGSKEKTKSIHDINTRESKDIKAMREKSIKQKGHMNHENLPDRQAEHRARIQQGFKKG